MKSQPKNKAPQKVPVNERALFARLQRALEKDGESLRRCRESSRSFHQLGKFYIVSIQGGCVYHMDVDLESLGRKMGVLKSFEHFTGD